MNERSQERKEPQRNQEAQVGFTDVGRVHSPHQQPAQESKAFGRMRYCTVYEQRMVKIQTSNYGGVLIQYFWERTSCMNETLRNLSHLGLLFIIVLVCAIWQAMLREFRLRTRESRVKQEIMKSQKPSL